jgi:hypothetical protein
MGCIKEGGVIMDRDRLTYILFAIIICVPVGLSMALAIALSFGGQS